MERWRDGVLVRWGGCWEAGRWRDERMDERWRGGEMERWTDGQMGRWRVGEMGEVERLGAGEMDGWGDGEMGRW